jgi:vacuolar-type H+-ATPase subunit C/Vma6
MLPPFGLFARVDASVARLLGPGGLSALVQAGSIAEIVEALRRSASYARYVNAVAAPVAPTPDPDGADGFRAELEQELARKPVDDLLAFVRFSTSRQRAFLLLLLRGFEAENVKRALRRISRVAFSPARPVHPEPGSDLEPVLYDLGAFASVTPDTLRAAAAGSLSSLVSTLSRSSLGSALVNALPPAEAMRSVLPLEMALDDEVVAQRYRAAGRLGAADRDGLRALLGTQADLLSLCWIFRGRFLFDLSPEEIIPRLPGCGRRLTPATIRSLAASPDPRALADRIATTAYAALLGPEGGLEADWVDLRAARILLAEARAARSGVRFDLSQVLAYLVLAEREVQDICAIIECAHYRLDRETTLMHLATEVA